MLSPIAGIVDFSEVKASVGKEIILDVRDRNELEKLGQIISSHNLPRKKIMYQVFSLRKRLSLFKAPIYLAIHKLLLYEL